MLKSKEESRSMKVALDYINNISYLRTATFSILEKISRRILKKRAEGQGWAGVEQGFGNSSVREHQLSIVK